MTDDDQQDKNAALKAKIAAMSDDQLEARVQELYAKLDRITEDETAELLGIMIGGL
jgi:hypothetical protein